jgi:uncharacterized protein YukE
VLNKATTTHREYGRMERIARLVRAPRSHGGARHPLAPMESYRRGRLRRVTPVLVLLVAGGLATACGSSTTSATQTPAPTPTPTAAPTPTATVSGGGSFCSQANTVLSQIAQVVAAVRQPGANTLAGFKAEIAALAQGLDNGDGTAPSAIAGAIHTMRVAYDQVNTALQSATTLTQVAAAFQPAETAAASAAGDQVTAYYHQNCAGG